MRVCSWEGVGQGSALGVTWNQTRGVQGAPKAHPGSEGSQKAHPSVLPCPLIAWPPLRHVGGDWGLGRRVVRRAEGSPRPMRQTLAPKLPQAQPKRKTQQQSKAKPEASSELLCSPRGKKAQEES